MDIFGLITALARIDWNTPYALSEAALCLTEVWQTGRTHELIADYLETLSYPEPDVKRTAELESWKLRRTPVWDLALNRFKDFRKDEDGQGRQASKNIHNHTRPLVSLTITGGYEQDFYEPKEPLCDYQNGQRWEGRLVKFPGPSTRPGHVYTIHTDVFHALTKFEPGTATLVVYGPLVQDSILCFNQLNGLVERSRTVTNAKGALIDILRSKKGA